MHPQTKLSETQLKNFGKNLDVSEADMNILIYTYSYVCMYVFMVLAQNWFETSLMHGHTYRYMPYRMHACICVCMYTCMHFNDNDDQSLHTYACTHMHTCNNQACLRVCVRTYIHTYIYDAYMHPYIHTYMYKYAGKGGCTITEFGFLVSLS